MAEYDASCGVVTDVEAANVNLGDGLEKVPVGRKTSSMIAGQGDMGDPEVEILSPPKEKVKSIIRCVKKGQYEVDYAPEWVGDHQVEVNMAGLHVQDFSIDASQVGAGKLEFECQIIDTQQQLSDWLELRSSDNVQNLCRLVRLVGGHGVGLELQTSTLPVMTSLSRLAVVTGYSAEGSDCYYLVMADSGMMDKMINQLVEKLKGTVRSRTMSVSRYCTLNLY